MLCHRRHSTNSFEGILPQPGCWSPLLPFLCWRQLHALEHFVHWDLLAARQRDSPGKFFSHSECQDRSRKPDVSKTCVFHWPGQGQSQGTCYAQEIENSALFGLRAVIIEQWVQFWELGCHSGNGDLESLASVHDTLGCLPLETHVLFLSW